MDSLAKLDRVLEAIAKVQRVNAKVSPSFQEHSASIAQRASRIARDVHEWDNAQSNLEDVQDEIEVAREMYASPRCVEELVHGGKRDSATIGAALVHLVHASQYIATHRPNVVGDKLKEELDENTQKAVGIAEAVVVSTAMQHLRTEKNTGVELLGIASITKRLYSLFDRRQLADDLKRSGVQEIVSVFEQNFGRSYEEDFEGISAALRDYRREAHPFFPASRAARRSMLILNVIIDEVIFKPMDADYEIAGIAASAYAAVVDAVLGRALRAVQVPLRLLAHKLRWICRDTHRVSVALEDSVSELLFASLDIVEEMWNWRDVAMEITGDAAAALSVIDTALGREFFPVVSDVIDAMQGGRGTLTEGFLEENDTLFPSKLVDSVGGVQYALASAGGHWLPSSDCMVHEMASRLFRSVKVLMTRHFGALKLVLGSRDVGRLLVPSDKGAEAESAAATATHSVLTFLSKCVVGLCDDLTSIGSCARAHGISNATAPVINVSIFVINNLTFFVEGLRRTESLRQPPRSECVSPILEALDNEISIAITEYGENWAAVFPPFRRQQLRMQHQTTDLELEDLFFISEALAPQEQLPHAQRMAVKHWYKEAFENLAHEVKNEAFHTLLNRSIRAELINAGIEAVRQVMGTVSTILRGREWSTRPEKWMQPPLEGIVASMQRLY